MFVSDLSNQHYIDLPPTLNQRGSLIDQLLYYIENMRCFGNGEVATLDCRRLIQSSTCWAGRRCAVLGAAVFRPYITYLSAWLPRPWRRGCPDDCWAELVVVNR